MRLSHWNVWQHTSEGANYTNTGHYREIIYSYYSILL